MPTLTASTLRLFFAALRRYRDYDDALIALEVVLTLEESETLEVFLAWVKAAQEKRSFGESMFAVRFREWQNELRG